MGQLQEQIGVFVPLVAVGESQQAQTKRYLYGVQGLRTVAALMVAAYHIWFHRVSGGVDVFFVVAGYFAAGSLLRVLEARSVGCRVRATRDYLLRTFRRVVPSATVVIVATVVGSMLWMPLTTWPNGVKQAFASTLFLENFQLVLLKTDYAEMGAATSPFQQFWALAIQVQSYAMFALLVLVTALIAGWLRRDAYTGVRISVAVIFTASFAYSIFSTTSNQAIAYFNPASRFWEFLAGAILAVVLPRLRLSSAFLRLVGWLGLAVVVLPAAFFDMSRLLPGAMALLPISGAAAIILASYHGAEPRILKIKPVLVFADSSFAFYLWHWPLLIFYRNQVSQDVSLWAGLAILAFSAALALATTNLVERPFRTWPLLQRSPFVSFIACLLMMVPSLGLSVVWRSELHSLQARDLAVLASYRSTGEYPLDAVSVPSPLIAKSDTTEANKNGCAARTKHTDLFSCTWGKNPDSDLTVALVGASHDTQWLTVVTQAADTAGAKTVSYLKNSCPFGNVGGADRNVVAGCETWSQQLLEELLSDPPAVLVTIATSRESGEEEIPAWKREYFDLLLAEGVSIVAIRDNPTFELGGPECVESGDPSICSFPQEDQFATLEDLDVPSDDAFYFVDLLQEYCPGGICSPLTSPVLGYYDSAHLTETWTLEHGSAVESAIAVALGAK